MRTDPFGLLPRVGPLNLSRIPRDLDSVTTTGAETPALGPAIEPAVERIWARARDLYASGAHPGLQVAVRHHGEVVLDRAIGHARGNGPTPDGFAPEPLTPQTPIGTFSASKGITAMVVLMLAERGYFDLDDPVATYVPDFTGGGRDLITIRHVLNHRAGVPSFPRAAWPDRASPAATLRAVCQAPVVTAAGDRLGYHVLTGGYLLGAVVQNSSGRSLRQTLRAEILKPLGFRWTNYGVAKRDIDQVATNYITGPTTPLSWHIERALGERLQAFVDMSNSPKALTALVPSGNLISTANEMSRFYEIFRLGGSLDGVRVVGPETVRLATTETSSLEMDAVLGVPLARWGHGQMLGARNVSVFGRDTQHAFGHLGFTQSLAWADPERGLSASILSTGKPVVGPGTLAWLRLVAAITASAPKIPLDQMPVPPL